MSEYIDGKCELDHRHTLVCSTPTPDAETVREMQAVLGGYAGPHADYVRRVVDAAPPLTADQRARLTPLLGGQAVPAPRPVQPVVKPVHPSRPCFLYRYFDQFGELLYVGISFDPVQRSRTHQRHAAWARFAHRTDIEEFPDEATAREAERNAIQSENPVFNVVHSTAADRDAALITYTLQHARKASV